MGHAVRLRSLRHSLSPLQHGHTLPSSVSRASSIGALAASPSPSSPRLVLGLLTARLSSTSAATQAAPKSTLRTTLLTPTAPNLSPAAANPPYTTRPPPLDLPTREPTTSTVSHLFRTGKAYLKFYKTGLKYIYLNTRLLYAQTSAAGASLPQRASTPTNPTTTGTPPSPPLRPASTTRAFHLLQARWRHDMRKLPLFGLLLLVCGEFTPLAVLLLPRLVPFPCRIPAQETALRAAAEARRAASFADLAAAVQASGAAAPGGQLVRTHVARSLGLIARTWDRAGLAPGWLAGGRVRRALLALAEDDALLLQSGGAGALEPDEVRLACEARGLDVQGKDTEELRRQLGLWLRLTKAGDGAGRVAKMEKLLTRRPEEW